MRRLLLIVGGVIGVAILIVVALVGYAYLNLNSIIAANRARLSGRTSASVGGSAPGAKSSSVGHTLKSPAMTRGVSASSSAAARARSASIQRSL